MTGEGVDAGVVQALADLVQQVWRLCQQVMRAEGVKARFSMSPCGYNPVYRSGGKHLCQNLKN